MEGTVIAVIGTEWCLIEFANEATGQMWRIKVQGNEEGSVPFALGTKVVLTEKGASE